MDYEEVPVGDRIYLQPKEDSRRTTLYPTDIVSVSVGDCPMGYCVKMEFGNITSVCKYMIGYGGTEEQPAIKSVRCRYGEGPAEPKVTLLGAFTCPIDRIGCIWLEQDGEKQCEYLRGVLPPMPTVRLHYSVLCDHPKESVGDI